MGYDSIDSSAKPKLSLKDRILGFVGFFCIPIFLANAFEFIKHWRPTDLVWCSIVLLVYVASLFFIDERLITIGAQFGALALFGTINSILRGSFPAIPVILIFGLVAFLLLLWNAKRDKQSRRPDARNLGNPGNSGHV